MAKGKTPIAKGQGTTSNSPKTSALPKVVSKSTQPVKAIPVKKVPTPNDQRSTVKNPTSKTYQVDQAHTAKQIAENKAKKSK